ncbi:TPA: HEPN domain-containing protein [Vibrio campbellii]
MSSTTQFITSKGLLDNLVKMAQDTQAKSVDFDAQDNDFFQENMNFFVKSYMVLMCAYLESYLKALSKSYIDKVEESLASSSYPKNLLRWSVQKEKYKHSNDGVLDKFSLGITSDDIDKNLSANPHKTSPFFTRLGIHLEALDEYNSIKEQIEMIVTKRNNIVHYNDDAGDTGITDIIQYADLIIQYMTILDLQVSSCIESIS